MPLRPAVSTPQPWMTSAHLLAVDLDQRMESRSVKYYGEIAACVPNVCSGAMVSAKSIESSRRSSDLWPTTPARRKTVTGHRRGLVHTSRSEARQLQMDDRYCL